MTASKRIAFAALVVALVATSVGTAAATEVDRVPVTSIESGETTGASTLARTVDGIRARITTREVTPGHAYTVWAVVFNTPEGCDGPCDAGDLANPAAGAASLLGDGGVARVDRTTFAVALPVGDGLTDALGAEVHFVIRTHGSAIPGLVGAQTSTLNGGCPPNTCANVQVALHAP